MFKNPNFCTSTVSLYFFLFNIDACKIYDIRYVGIDKLIFFSGVVNCVRPTYGN